MTLDAFPGWSEQVLAASVACLGGRTYGGRGEATTDCCRFVEQLLIALYGDHIVAEHEALMVLDHSEPYSPVDAVVRLGLGRVVDSPRFGSWHVVQAWRQLTASGGVPAGVSPNGHTFLYYEPAGAVLGSGVVVEANVRRPFLYPSTWGDQIAPYLAGVKIAALEPVT